MSSSWVGLSRWDEAMQVRGAARGSYSAVWGSAEYYGAESGRMGQHGTEWNNVEENEATLGRMRGGKTSWGSKGHYGAESDSRTQPEAEWDNAGE